MANVLTGREILKMLDIDEYGMTPSADDAVRLAMSATAMELRRIASEQQVRVRDARVTRNHIVRLVDAASNILNRNGLIELPGPVGERYASARERIVAALGTLDALLVPAPATVPATELFSQLGIDPDHATDMRLPTVKRCPSLVCENIALRVAEIARRKGVEAVDLSLDAQDIEYLLRRARLCADEGHMLSMEDEGIARSIENIFATLERLHAACSKA